MRIEEHVLFGKYRLCRKLGKGRSGSVYLAFHLELEEYRAVKIVPKSLVDYEAFRREALFLKTLRHPGIPLVYDVEEDETNSYLIEEYLEGESLYALVKRLGSLSTGMALEYGIQISRIIQFMNSANDPILYLDLQPKNLLVREGEVRLTDFDHAQYAKETEKSGERYGTVSFAAPEQRRGEPLDCRTDVYAIGALLFFMIRGRPPGARAENDGIFSHEGLGRIIDGCMAQEKEERFQSAGDVLAALLELQEKQRNQQAIQSQTILFAGAKAGIGTTHAAFGMLHFLTQNGFSALYQEEYDTDAVRVLAGNLGLAADGAGVYHLGECSLRPYYGSFVHLPYRYFPMIIKDAGVSWKEGKEPKKAELYVVLCGGKWWETGAALQAARYFKALGPTVLLFNHVSEEFRLKLPEDLSAVSCLRLPFFPNPFGKSPLADQCFKEILSIKTGGEQWEEGKKRRRFWGRKKGS